jgi:hypothetical protein
MKRRRPEQAVHRAVFQHLQLRGTPNIFAFHPANGGARSPIEGAIFKSLGVVAGVPDIIVIHDGRCFGLELKAEGGRLTPIQTETHERMQRAGAIVGVAHGIDQALATLERWGLLRGRAA